MKITDFGYNGEGVGHVDGKVCFVPYTLEGEEVEVEKVKETSSFVKCRLKEVKTKSPKRKIAPCPYFGKCGGCDFQHMDYQDEFKLKTNILARHFAKVEFNGNIKAEPSEKEYSYRNKIKLFAGAKSLGLNMEGSDKVVEIDKCLLIDEDMNVTLQKLNNFVGSMKLNKVLENVVIRKQGKQVFVWFIYKKAVEVDYNWLSYILGKNYSIFQSVGKESPVCMAGKSEFNVQEFGLECKYSVESFHQVNNEVCEKLYQAVCNELVGQSILNAYSGGGVLSGVIAKSGKDVIGVEWGQAEHEAAQRLKEDNDLSTLTNIQGDCAVVIPELKNRFDTIVIDPPRAGIANEVCEAIESSGAKRIIYISCNPATLVRDLQRLGKYQIQKVILFDMFARTANFETLVVLDKKQNIIVEE